MDTRGTIGAEARGLESWKALARRRAGKALHAMGAYRTLLPFRLREPRGIARRLQSYLLRYYESEMHAEAVLELPDLGATFACDIRDHMLWWHVAGSDPVYEISEIDYCRAHVRSGDHILDIGANHGFWGFALAKRAGPSGRLYLAEANPRIVRRLRKTAELNPQVVASVLPFAVSDGTAESLEFYLPRDNLSGLGSTVLHDVARQSSYLEPGRRIAVPSVSIDQLMMSEVIHGIDIMKIDVEGAEDWVLRGAMRALRRFAPRLIMIETSNDSAAFGALCGLDYRPYLLLADGRRREVPQQEHYWGNVFFEREGRSD